MSIFQEDAIQKKSLIGGHSVSGSNFKVYKRSRCSSTYICISIYACKWLVIQPCQENIPVVKLFLLMNRNTTVYVLTVPWFPNIIFDMKNCERNKLKKHRIHYKSWGKKWYLHYWSLFCENHISCCALDLVKTQGEMEKQWAEQYCLRLPGKCQTLPFFLSTGKSECISTNQNFLEESMWRRKKWKRPNCCRGNPLGIVPCHLWVMDSGNMVIKL